MAYQVLRQRVDGARGTSKPKYKSARNKMTLPIRQRSAKRKEIIDECLVEEKILRGNSYGHRGGRDKTLIDNSAEAYKRYRGERNENCYFCKRSETNKKLKRLLRVRQARKETRRDDG